MTVETNSKGERCIGSKGVNARTVEEFNAAVQNMVRKVHGTKDIEMVSHVNSAIIKNNGGFVQFAPSFQSTIVVDMSQMTEVEKKRVAKIVKSCNRNTPTTMVNAE